MPPRGVSGDVVAHVGASSLLLGASSGRLGHPVCHFGASSLLLGAPRGTLSFHLGGPLLQRFVHPVMLVPPRFSSGRLGAPFCVILVPHRSFFI